MAQAVEVTGIPNKAKAEAIARSMRLLFPDWTVEILGSAPPYTVRRTPPDEVVEDVDTQVTGEPRSGVLGFLDFIAEYESRGNYNARFGATTNVSQPRFTTMTVDEVLDWQTGRKYSACGKYQIIRATLDGLKRSLNLGENDKYDPDLQDRLGTELLHGRGLRAFLDGQMARGDFALSVAREWAALPGVLPPHGAKSVYAGDGVNQAHVDVDTYLAATDRLKAEA